MRTFDEALVFGQIAEDVVANYLRWQFKANIWPIYETEKSSGKGPRLHIAGKALIAPDIFAARPNGREFFVEVKHKTVFAWFRKNESWQTGIDKRCYEDYLEVRCHYNHRLWLAFLQSKDEPDPKDLQYGSPSECPTGLFVGEIRKLAKCIVPSSGKYANGMVYWRHRDLKRVASLVEVKRADREIRGFL